VTIRGIRAQLEDRLARMGPRKSAGLTRAAKPLLMELGSIENVLYQTKNRSSQDPLNYPIKLNNKIAALGPTVASVEAKPTVQAREAFSSLAAELDKELGRLSRVLERSLPGVNAELRRAGLEPVTPDASTRT
jgi:hypothetical protein